MPSPEPRPSIKSTRGVSSYNVVESPVKDYSGSDYISARPNYARSTTFEGPTQLRRDASPMSAPRMARAPSDSLTIRTTRSQLRTVSKPSQERDVFVDPSDDSAFYSNSSPDRSYGERSVSPATSNGSIPSRTASSTTLNANVPTGRKGPPPPPPSRAKKPPPPPPAKRVVLT